MVAVWSDGLKNEAVYFVFVSVDKFSDWFGFQILEDESVLVALEFPIVLNILLDELPPPNMLEVLEMLDLSKGFAATPKIVLVLFAFVLPDYFEVFSDEVTSTVFLSTCWGILKGLFDGPNSWDVVEEVIEFVLKILLLSVRELLWKEFAEFVENIDPPPPWTFPSKLVPPFLFDFSSGLLFKDKAVFPKIFGVLELEVENILVMGGLWVDGLVKGLLFIYYLLIMLFDGVCEDLKWGWIETKS